MHLLRIALVVIVALLVSMPLAVCNKDCGTQALRCELSCCIEEEIKAADACHCDCVQVCPKFQFELRDLILSSAEVSAPDAPKQPAAIHELILQQAICGMCIKGGDRLYAPPYCLIGMSRQVILCVFRW